MPHHPLGQNVKFRESDEHTPVSDVNSKPHPVRPCALFALSLLLAHTPHVLGDDYLSHSWCDLLHFGEQFRAFHVW